MKLEDFRSLRYHLKIYQDFFLSATHELDLRFLYTEFSNEYVPYKGDILNVWTRNALYIDVNLDTKLDQAELMNDPQIREMVIKYRDFIFDEFPIKTFTYFSLYRFGYLHHVKIMCNVVPLRKIDSLELTHESFIQVIDSEWHWNVTNIFSLLPKDSDNAYSHRIVFAFYNPYDGFVDFDYAD